MSVHSLIINYGVEPSPSDAFVQLEQDPIDENINYLTVQQAATALEHFMSGKPLPPTYCSPGTVRKILYAYPWPNSLTEYRCIVTKGELERGTLLNVDIIEELNCDLVDVLNTTYPVHQIKSSSWKTSPYNSVGAEVTEPTLSLDGPKIKLSAKVYGTLEVVYTTKQEIMSDTITYNNVVVEGETLDPYLLCVWSGGNSALKIKFADGEEDIDCNNQYSVGNIEDGPYDPGYVEGEDEIHEFDYCTGEELE
jgi:hypothetical protein